MTFEDRFMNFAGGHAPLIFILSLAILGFHLANEESGGYLPKEGHQRHIPSSLGEKTATTQDHSSRLADPNSLSWSADLVDWQLTKDISDMIATSNQASIALDITQQSSSSPDITTHPQSANTDTAAPYGSTLPHVSPQGSSTEQVTFTWQQIGDTGNPSMTTTPSRQVNTSVTVGRMDEEYAITKYEVSNSQWAAFLNAKACESDPHGLYNPQHSSHHWGGIMRSGSGPYTYAPKAGRENYPVNFVSVMDVARFVNWLQNGQGNADTEDGTYDMDQAPLITRKGGSQIYIPNENEWHKAAYYDPRIESEGGPPSDTHYWLYPALGNNTPNKATVQNGVITNSELPNLANYDHSANDLDGQCRVNTGGVNCESYYGVRHMGGNVVEWIEDRHSTSNPTWYDLRGGDWENGHWDQRNHFINAAQPFYESTDNGIRLAASLGYLEREEPAGGGSSGGGEDGCGLDELAEPFINQPFTKDTNTIALYHFTNNLADSSDQSFHLNVAGGTTNFTSEGLDWMLSPSGSALCFSGIGDEVTVDIPDSLILPHSGAEFTIEWYQKVDCLATAGTSATLIELEQSYDTHFRLRKDTGADPIVPTIGVAGTDLLDETNMALHFKFGVWQKMRITFDSSSTTRGYIDGQLIATITVDPNIGRSNDWTLSLGNFDGCIDELRLSNTVRPDETSLDGSSSEYQQWAAIAFASLPQGASDPDAQLLANPDGDEATNLFEFATATDPLDRTDARSVQGEIEVIDGDSYMVVKYRRLKSGNQLSNTHYEKGSLAYYLESSDGLTATWKEEPARWDTPQSVVDHGDGTETVEVKTHIDAIIRRFVRLRIATTP